MVGRRKKHYRPDPLADLEAIVAFYERKVAAGEHHLISKLERAEEALGAALAAKNDPPE